MGKFIRSLGAPESDAARRRSLTINNAPGAARRMPDGERGAKEMLTLNFNNIHDLLYKGRADRLERLAVYDMMDADADISRALDIIAEHCTQNNEQTHSPFDIKIEGDEISSVDVELLYDMMKSWNKINNWDNLAFNTVRNCVKYGDAFFIRQNNFKLFPVKPSNVAGVYVDNETFEILGYLITGLSQKFSFMIEQPSGEAAYAVSNVQRSQAGGNPNQRTYTGIFPAEHILHLSLNPGREIGGNGSNNDVWPFGTSYLEQVYRDFKNRSLMEEAEIIHRIQRAPSRRVFYIDTGRMREDQERAELRRVRNEIFSKRVPTRDGGGDRHSTLYNPMSQNEDIFLARRKDDRGTKVENLEGQAWNNDGALKYFTTKVLRGLRVPTSFMMGAEEGGSQYNDGRMGSAYMEEFHFSKICERLQHLMDNEFDFEFKMYVRSRDINVNASLYDIGFMPPMNFDHYRDSALMQDSLSLMGSASGVPGLSVRFKYKKYLGLTDDEIIENEQLWLEENQSAIARQLAQDNHMGGMGAGMAGGFDSQAGMFGAGGMDGGMPGMEGLGDGLGDGMGGGAGGMGGGAGGMGGMGGGAGGGAGGAPGGMAGGMGMESRRPKTGTILFENQKFVQYGTVASRADKMRMLSEAETGKLQVTKKIPNADPVPGRDDHQFGIGLDDDADKTPVMPLSHVRKLRIEREMNREEMIKRLVLMPSIYAIPDPNAGGGGMF